MELNDEQQRALKFIDDNQNVFITGGAGVGKSFLINYYRRLNSNKNILVCAPTGVASINIGGSTLHRTFHIPVHLLMPNEPLIKFAEIIQMLRHVDIIIIDEISMCRQDVFEYVCRYVYYENKDRSENKYRFGTPLIKLILVGDFYQLPPVLNYKEKDLFRQIYGNEHGFAFQSNAWTMFNIQTFELKTVVRQKDKDFSESLNRIRKNIGVDTDYINLNKADNYIKDAIFLCSKNDQASDINQRKLDELKTEERDFRMIKDGDIRKIKPSDMCVPELVTLKIGCRVMSVVNDQNELYQNGSLGTVVGFDDDSVIVRFDNGCECGINTYTFDIIGYDLNADKVLNKTIIASYTQIPLKLAYAITIHKSQGQTYDSVNIDISQIFSDGQLYVALSRCRSIQKTFFEGYLSNSKIKTSKTVLNYFEN